MKKLLTCGILLCSLALTSCSSIHDIKEKVIYYATPVANEKGERIQLYNSTISITTYNDKLLNQISPTFQKTVEDIHIASDRYNYFLDENNNRINNLKVVNDSYGSGKEIKVDDYLFNLLDLAIEMHTLSEGYFNPTMGSLIDLWKDTIPDIENQNKMDIVGTNEFNEAFNEMIPFSEEDPLSNYIVLNEEEHTVKFNKYKDIDDIKISLGGIAKGYGMYVASNLFKDYKDPIMIDGGTSSLALLNPQPYNDYYKIGVVAPYKDLFGDPNVLYAIDVDAGTNISTSGDYNHFMNVIDEDGNKVKKQIDEERYTYVRRHHILNPFKGYSENYYRVMNINANGRADVLDALSTALFNIDIINNKKQFLRVVDNFEKAYDIEIEFLMESEINYLNSDNEEVQKLNVYMSSGMEELIDRDYKDGFKYINSENIIKK